MKNKMGLIRTIDVKTTRLGVELRSRRAEHRNMTRELILMKDTMWVLMKGSRAGGGANNVTGLVTEGGKRNCEWRGNETDKQDKREGGSRTSYGMVNCGVTRMGQGGVENENVLGKWDERTTASSYEGCDSPQERHTHIQQKNASKARRRTRTVHNGMDWSGW